jgi:tetratricopeptide (TPR) repeat protein
MDNVSLKYPATGICLALALITLVVFWQVRNFEFIHYDDVEYITQNPHIQSGLNLKSIKWAFTTGYASNWHPLTWLSHILDCRIFGLAAGGHHLVNLLLHIINTLLLFVVLARATGRQWPSAFVAALFALHPLHVESVAWVSERKDVLSGLFWMLTMLAYVRYVQKPSAGMYLLALLMFALGLMAKPMLVTLPFVLLLLDYWPLNRLKTQDLGLWTRATKLFLEKVPFFVFSTVSSVVTFLVQRSAGAVKDIHILPLDIRLANALISYVRYIIRMFRPTGLAMFYPYDINKLFLRQAIAAAAMLLVISVLVVRFASGRRYLPVGWLWYIGMLVPVIGLVQVGNQSFADRYTYMPLIGLFIIVSWGMSDVLAGWSYGRIIAGVLMSVVISVLSICTFFQVGYWRDSIRLYEHTLAVTSNNSIIHHNLAFALQSKGISDRALSHYQQSLRIEPNFAEVHNNFGIALQSLGRLDEAISHYQQAIKLKPNYVKALNNLGNALSEKGLPGEAVDYFQKGLQFEPNNPELHNNLGLTLQSEGKLDEAISHFRSALRYNPEFYEAHFCPKGRLKKQLTISVRHRGLNQTMLRCIMR